MDHHKPLLFVNAVNYRGLLAAAKLADRINHGKEALYWRRKAEEIEQAWRDAFKPPETLNPRTFISGLWPTWIAKSSQDAYYQGLLKRWSSLRDKKGNFRKRPSWTYFDVAEAHQWLFLKRPDHVWATLNWFWNNQASPGLYTWWEGKEGKKGGGNAFPGWENVRGWIKPQPVTPHYWTAAEMLLLQLDMLAYIDESEDEPIIVIGAGIPKAWLNHSMRVQGLSLNCGKIDWDWDSKKKRINTVVYNSKVEVRFGSSFAADTVMKVLYK